MRLVKSATGSKQRCGFRTYDSNTASYVSCCPGFCRTGMTLKSPWSPTSWVFFAASWIIGQSAHAGADTPVWLALEADRDLVGGKFVRARHVKS